MASSDAKASQARDQNHESTRKDETIWERDPGIEETKEQETEKYGQNLDAN